MGAQRVTRFFQNFEVDIKIPKSPKLALITKILKKILKTFSQLTPVGPIVETRADGPRMT